MPSARDTLTFDNRLQYSATSSRSNDAAAQSLKSGILGIALGGLAATWATRVLGTMLFEVDTRDPISYGVGAVGLLFVALGASLLPARRAARVQPVRALASA